MLTAMLSFNVRAAKRSWAVPRTIPTSKRLFARTFWGIFRSGSTEEQSAPSSDVNPRARESNYSKLLGLMGRDAADQQQSPGPLHHGPGRTVRTAPIFTVAVDKFVHSALPPDEQSSKLISQYGLIGSRRDRTTASREDNLVMENPRIPWSAFICGEQGAGKSHTLACLLENALVANNDAGAPYPLAGMAMHYDRYTRGTRAQAQACEAARLCSSGIPVTVLVSPSNFEGMKRLYTKPPGLLRGGLEPKVVPLYLEERQINVSRILKFLGINTEIDDHPPIYATEAMKAIREMAMEIYPFSYRRFLERLADVNCSAEIKTRLHLRLLLLDSFIAPSPTTKSRRPAQSLDDIWAFKRGSLTIIDLSDPIINSDEACALFSVSLSIFHERGPESGRILALDDAHKFLVRHREGRDLTTELLEIIREPKHARMRVVIAAEDPVPSPKFISKVNATFVHRVPFDKWYNVLKAYLRGFDNQDSSSYSKSLFPKIHTLQTGQALLFCPKAQVDVVDSPQAGRELFSPTADGGNSNVARRVSNLGDGYVDIKIRKSLAATEHVAQQLVTTPVPMKSIRWVTPSDSGNDREVKGKSWQSTDSSLSTLPSINESTPDADLTSPTTREKMIERLSNASDDEKSPISQEAIKKEDQNALFEPIAKETYGLARDRFNRYKWKNLSSLQIEQRRKFFKELESKCGLKYQSIRSNKTLSDFLTMQIDHYLMKLAEEKKMAKKKLAEEKKMAKQARKELGRREKQMGSY